MTNVAEIRERHWEAPSGRHCYECDDPWPCDAVKLLALAEKLAGALDAQVKSLQRAGGSAERMRESTALLASSDVRALLEGRDE